MLKFTDKLGRVPYRTEELRRIYCKNPAKEEGKLDY